MHARAGSARPAADPTSGEGQAAPAEQEPPSQTRTMLGSEGLLAAAETDVSDVLARCAPAQRIRYEEMARRERALTEEGSLLTRLIGSLETMVVTVQVRACRWPFRVTHRPVQRTALMQGTALQSVHNRSLQFQPCAR
jgi:hypothetical protein